jgi:hypothetical protein
MTWNKTLPAPNEKIRNLSSVITSNWYAIEQAKGGLAQWAIVLANRSVAPVNPGEPVDPAAISNAGILYSKTSGSAVELFYLRPTGSAVQLTGQSSVVANGYTTLPGGIIMQWGTASIAGGVNKNVTVTLPIVMPTAVLNVQVTLNDGTYAEKAVTWGPVNTASFKIYKSASQPHTVNWLAIGH